MSRDCNYILSYESQSYASPTPMELDKLLIAEQERDRNQSVNFTDLDDGFTIHAELSKYGLLPDVVEKLKADKIFERVDGDPFKEIR